MKGAITEVEGIKVGHASDFSGITGCTVVLCEEGAVGGFDIRGYASGTRGLDALSPFHLVEKVHAILIAGGSAFGLEATGGVMQYLEERGIGFEVRVTRVPIVASAIIFDLRLGDPKARPDKAMGYQACLNARNEQIEEGSVGAGTGASVGKLFGIEQAMKGGLGPSSVRLPGGLVVGALVVVNAFGDVIDETGRVLAGTRDSPSGKRLINTALQMKAGVMPQGYSGENTTIAVIATNATLSKVEATAVARMAHDGLAQTIRPVHTSLDGDTVFALATGRVEGKTDLIGLAASDAIVLAARSAVTKAKGLGGLPAYRDLP